MKRSRTLPRLSLIAGGILCTTEFVLAQSGSLPPDFSPAPVQPAEATAERVIVTGSNIPTAEEVGPNPVLEVDRQYINQSGERNLEQFLRDLPVAGPQGVPSFNGANGAAPGASSISLRGFDPSDTLVLIDGRRVAPYPIGASGTQSFVDLNTIPRAAIGSIEILKDSASAIYGADAVAGVVNIKLRHDYHGAEANVEYGNSLDKDAAIFSASLLFGVGDSSTSISGVLNYYHRNSLFDRDRGFSNVAAPFSSSSSPFNLQLSADVVIAAGGTPPSDRSVFYGHAPLFSNGLAPASDYIYTNGRSSFYNTATGRGSIPESERYGGFVNTEHKIFGDQLVAYADFFYQNVKTRSELAPTPTGVFEQPGKTVLAIPPNHPLPGGITPPDTPTFGETGLPLNAYNPFNPFEQIISGGTRGRLAEFGNRILDNTSDAFFTTLGLKGDKLFNGSWGYDGSFRYSEIKNTAIEKVTSASRFNRILNAADPIFNPASPEFIGTTLPYNPFGDYRVPIPGNVRPIEFATVYPKEVDVSSLAVFDLNIYTTELFKLPAGGFGLAFGGQFRRETLRQRPDELSLTGDILGQSAGTFTNAGRKTYALYVEGSLPIFSPSFSAPGFHALEFTAAARYEEFLSNGSNVLVPKFGMRWQPFDESLTIRATWGEGFHEPSLIELFGTPSEGLVNTFDRQTGSDVNEVPFIIRSNRQLQPEDSRAFSGGVVYSPKYLSGLTLAIDLFDIESIGRVNSHPDPFDIINRAIAGRSLPGEKVTRDAEGNVISIEGAYQNGGSQKARGADFTLQYEYSTSFGTFTSLTQATYLDSFEFAGTPDVPERELRSSGFSSAEAYFKWKAQSRLVWSWKNFDLVGTLHYRDGFHEFLKFPFQFRDPNNPGTPFQQAYGHEHYVKQTWFFDGQLSYTFSFTTPIESNPGAGYSKGVKETGSSGSGEAATSQTATSGMPVWKRLASGTTITLGCDDIFGQDPPHSLGNYPIFAYDPSGRFVYVKLTKNF